MEGAESATAGVVTSPPPSGVGSERLEEVVAATQESGTSAGAQVGTHEEGSSSASSAPPVGGGKEEGVLADEEAMGTSREESLPGNAKISSSLIAGRTTSEESPLNYLSSHPPPPEGSFDASGWVPPRSPSVSLESPRDETGRVVGAVVDAGGGGEPHATGIVLESVDTFTCHTSSLPPYLSTAAPAAFSTATGTFYASPSMSAYCEATGRGAPEAAERGLAPPGETAVGSAPTCHKSGLMEKLLPSFLFKKEERLLPCSPLSTGREDDIIEFVVEKPTDDGGTALPCLVTTEEGLLSSSASPHPSPPYSDDEDYTDSSAYFGIRENVCMPVREIIDGTTRLHHQQQKLLQRQQQKGVPLLQDGLRTVYTSVPPGAFVFARAAKGEAGKEAKLAFLGEENVPTFSSFVPPLSPHKAGAPQSLWSAGLPPPPYSTMRARKIQDGDFSPFVTVAQNLPVGVRQQAHQRASPLPANLTTVAVPRRLPASREVAKADKVVIPDAKRMLCFGHAGDEVKFCFGLLQLPPPAVKYDFLIERRKTCFGLCETARYVAVCRKCRMRLQTCPFCHKQSAIRHP